MSKGAIKLSESEFLEILNLHASNAMTSLTTLVTYLFGFITAVYIVGSKLSKMQAIIISILYIFASLAWITTALTHTDSSATLVAAYPSYVPSVFWFLPWSILVVSLGISALIASLYLMYDVRSENGKSDT